MNSFNFNQNPATNFRLRKLSKTKPDNCSGHCLTEIQKRLPLGINDKVFGTYQCLCCNTYQFESGKTCPEGGGIYG